MSERRGQMGGREVPFDPDERCDICGKGGAFDFMGGLFCRECTKGLVNYDGTPIDEETARGERDG